MDSYYGLINEGKTAVIEMASCAGLPLVEDRKDPRKTNYIWCWTADPGSS